MYLPNPHLAPIESSKAYKDMESLIAKALEHQWQDLLLSGLVNAFFTRYKDFFVNRRGVKIKIRKAVTTDPLNQEDDPANNDITSIDELKQEETRTQQRDRLLLPEKILNMAALIAFLNSRIDKEMNTVGGYYKFSSELKGYLKSIANKGGQSIIDLIDTPRPINFRLSQSEYVDKINERVITLIKELDETTKKRMVNQLVEGIRAGETKSELVKRISDAGLQLSKNRAKRIVLTETQAINEYMRMETARLNGVRTKVWNISDEDACPICLPLDQVEIPINNDFNSDGVAIPYPPAHTTCRCFISYSLQNNACSDFVKSRRNTLDEKIQFLKAAADYSFYDGGDEGDISSCVNPNAVWAGGESLVGPDKNIGNIYNSLNTSAFHEDMLNNYQGQLSDEGMVQLRLSLGLKGNVTRTT